MQGKAVFVANVKKFLREAGCDAPVTHSDETIFTVGDASRAVGAPPEVVYSVHCHNDFGLATACSIAAIKAGANNYIVKPFTPEIVKTKLEPFLKPA